MTGDLVTLTENAIKKIKEIMEKENKNGYGLRMRVMGGGCSGLTYNLNIEKESNDKDHVLITNGLRVYIDRKSLVYLNGIELDYVETLTESGFKFNNPNAKKTCGCGSSFS